MEETGLDKMPKDILLSIFHLFSNHSTLIQSRKTCKTLYEISQNHDLKKKWGELISAEDCISPTIHYLLYPFKENKKYKIYDKNSTGYKSNSFYESIEESCHKIVVSSVKTGLSACTLIDSAISEKKSAYPSISWPNMRTIGTDFKSLTIAADDKKLATLQLWAFYNGDCSQKSISWKITTRDAEAFIVIFDCGDQNSLDLLQKRIDLIRLTNTDNLCPILIVGINNFGMYKAVHDKAVIHLAKKNNCVGYIETTFKFYNFPIAEIMANSINCLYKERKRKIEEELRLEQKSNAPQERKNEKEEICLVM